MEKYALLNFNLSEIFAFDKRF